MTQNPPPAGSDNKDAPGWTDPSTLSVQTIIAALQALDLDSTAINAAGNGPIPDVSTMSLTELVVALRYYGVNINYSSPQDSNVDQAERERTRAAEVEQGRIRAREEEERRRVCRAAIQAAFRAHTGAPLEPEPEAPAHVEPPAHVESPANVEPSSYVVVVVEEDDNDDIYADYPPYSDAGATESSNDNDNNDDSSAVNVPGAADASVAADAPAPVEPLASIVISPGSISYPAVSAMFAAAQAAHAAAAAQVSAAAAATQAPSTAAAGTQGPAAAVGGQGTAVAVGAQGPAAAVGAQGPAVTVGAQGPAAVIGTQGPAVAATQGNTSVVPANTANASTQAGGSVLNTLPASDTWYCVSAGKSVGVFQGWYAVQPLVSGVPHACYKKYPSQDAANIAFQAAMNGGHVFIL